MENVPYKEYKLNLTSNKKIIFIFLSEFKIKFIKIVNIKK